METRIGTLEFEDGAPTAATAEKVRDALDFTRALNVYNNSFRGASAYAIGEGFQSIGADDNTIVIFQELMDAKSLFLTANADTVCFVGILTKDGMFKPFPPTGARTLDSRTAFYFAYTMDSPGMIMRIPGVGSPYLMGFLDSRGNPFDGAKTYKVTLPKGIPARAFWSFTVYDNQSRSMLDTPQRYPRAGSQSYPSPAANPGADGSTTVYFGPAQPSGVDRGNRIQTLPGKGGSRSCASTARSRRSSTRPGGRAKSSWLNNVGQLTTGCSGRRFAPPLNRSGGLLDGMMASSSGLTTTGWSAHGVATCANAQQGKSSGHRCAISE